MPPGRSMRYRSGGVPRFLPYFRGRTLGLFTARSRMRMVHEQIAGPLHEKGCPVLCQGDGALSKLREEFEKRDEVSLFGVRSLWEGIDVPGKSLSFVFMSKMPFPSLGDPVERARVAAVERAGGSSSTCFPQTRTIRRSFSLTSQKGMLWSLQSLLRFCLDRFLNP